MRLTILAIVLSTTAASADAPRGRYLLSGGKVENAPAIPSCGKVATDFLEGLERLHVRIGDEVIVNRLVWSETARQPDGSLVLTRDDVLPGFLVAIHVDRGAPGARGSVNVFGVRTGVGKGARAQLGCADARVFRGQFLR